MRGYVMKVSRLVEQFYEFGDVKGAERIQSRAGLFANTALWRLLPHLLSNS